MRLNFAQRPLAGELTVPADKSISHRSIMFGAISQGTTRVHNFLPAADCLSTIEAFRALGVTIKQQAGEVVINGRGLKTLQPATAAIDVGNSGTTMRLLLGILAGRKFETTLFGDASLNRRPMERVMTPLRQMGAKVSGHGEFPPITITGADLTGITYEMPVASAQVKSAILFAALQAHGTTTIIEKAPSRNHTEEMIQQFGGQLTVEDKTITLTGGQHLTGQEVTVPGDISSAAFFLVAATLIKNSHVTLKQVGINPTRTGILTVLSEMGAAITTQQTDEKNQAADLVVTSQPLRATKISGAIIPKLIDELPIIALAATQAHGRTVISDAEELKVKETNRIDTTAAELTKMGADITVTPDGLIINGPTPLHGAKVASHGDHRIGMMLAIAAQIATGETELAQPEAVKISYPNFFHDLTRLGGD